MNYAEIVRKLVGPINPVGDSVVDHERFENLKIMIGLVDGLLSDIFDVRDDKDSHLGTVKTAGQRANIYLNKIENGLYGEDTE